MIRNLFTYTDHMTISTKLLISMLALTAIVLTATLGLARWSFEQGFAEFINGLEKERLGRISEQIIFEYRLANNSWEDIEQHQELLGSGHRRPPPRRPIGSPPPPFQSSKNALPLTYLVDINGDILLSSSNQIPTSASSAKNDGVEIEMPIVWAGDTIAFLRSYTLKPISTSLASQFESQQLRASYFIGVVSLAIAIALALFIAKLFVIPIKKLSAGVSQLTDGKYELSFKNTGTDELAKLMRDTESLANTLEKSRSQKNRWFADISHELRTPLTILVGEIEAIRAGIRKFDEKQLESIEQEVNLLHRLVDDLYQLSLSDVGALKYEFKDTDISNMVVASLSSFDTQFKEKCIHLECNISQGIRHSVDHQRFEQLLNNILNNSLKYTDAGGVVKVTLMQTDTTIDLSVEDSHPSVPEAECESMFDILYQGNESRSRANTGAGLGLAICRNIADSHHAKLCASPSELGGVKILLSLPRDRANK